jgi:NADPH2:quinone reductase
MRAYVLHHYGEPHNSFRLEERPDLTPRAGHVVIDVEAFGINYADITARRGMYRDAPPKPCVVGYEVTGRIRLLGEGVTGYAPGDRVIALTRFGGYATQAEADARAMARIPEGMDAHEALALTVQYSTAYYAAEDRVRIFPGDKVLIHAAAGGVGSALVQLARRRGATIFGTAGSDEKLKLLRELGVHHPINYRKQDFAAEVRKVVGDAGLDIAFDSLGGKLFKQTYKLLGVGGRIVGYGAADRMDGAKGILGDIRLLLGFGFYNPAFLLMQTRTLSGVNMLRLADHRPEALRRVLEAVVDLANKGEVKPILGGVYPHTQLAEAHAHVESRKSVGKIVITW